MATAYLTFGYAGGSTPSGEPVMVLNGRNARTEAVTTSGTSAQSTFTASGAQVVVIFCATAVYANCGSNPTAAAATGILCPGGIEKAIFVEDGDKVALIDA